MGITFKINVQFILNEYDEKLNFKQKKIKTMNDEMFQRILDEIKSSSKTINVLPLDEAARQAMKEKYRIKSGSLMAAILENTGGIVIDNWIRLYGSGELNFVTRNSLFPFNEIVIGEDILGGLFICLDDGNIGYFAPDCLEMEDMEIKFGQFVYWCLHGDTDKFYTDYRWDGWQNDASKLKSSEGAGIDLFFQTEAESLESRVRKVVPMDEILRLQFAFLGQDDKNE